jgi:hypothetical protein
MLSAASLIGDFAATPGCDALAAGAEERFNHDEHEDYHEEVGSGWQTARAPYSNLLRKRSVLIQNIQNPMPVPDLQFFSSFVMILVFFVSSWLNLSLVPASAAGQPMPKRLKK